MPKRQNVKEIPSDEVQGEDSWIRVRRPTVEEIMVNQKRENVEGLGMDVRYEHSILSAMKYVLAWNWVDEKDVPLPQPGTGDVHKKLTDKEVTFILVTVFGDEEKRKN